MSNVPLITLKLGKQVPKIGFGNGTALFASDSSKSVAQAIRGGYRFIDTAEFYKNSQYVGAVFKQENAKQLGIQVVAKVGDLSRIRQVALEERDKLQVDKLDLLLVHSPPRAKDGLPSNVEAWETLIQLKDEGVADVIGVSNWLASDIEEVVASKPKYPIEVNEIEHHPLLIGETRQQKLLEVQKREGIASLIYGSLLPITHFADPDSKLTKVLESIAEREQGWTSATVLFKWASQTTSFGTSKDGSHDGILITTTNKPERIQEYLSLFDSRFLTDDEIAQITEAGKEQKQRKKYMVNYYEARAE